MNKIQPAKATRAYLERLLSERLAVHPPLRLEDWLDDVARLAADGDLHRVVLGLDVEPCVLERLDDGHTGVEPLHALELRAGVVVERAIVVEDVDELELVPHADFVVVRVVCGSDLHGTRTKGHVDGDVICHDGDAPVKEGVLREFAVQMLRERGSAELYEWKPAKWTLYRGSSG